VSYEHERIELDEGVVIRIVQDTDPINPRDDRDCMLGWMFTSHPRYQFGGAKWDESFSDDFSWTCPKCEGAGELETCVPASKVQTDPVTCEKCEGDGSVHPRSLNDIEEYLRTEQKAIVCLPLVIYDHSGVSMKVGSSFACDSGGWDTSQVGFIYTTQERVDELGVPQDSIEEQLRNEIEEYDQWGTGDVWGYIIDTPDEDHVESCWNFYGTDYIKDEARAAAQSYVEDLQARKRNNELALRVWAD
jgi:hypothetical protein